MLHASDVRPQIALCANAAMAMALSVTVRSIVRRRSCPVDFHIAADGFSPSQKQRLLAAVDSESGNTVRFVDLEPFRSVLREVGARETTYDRFLLGEALPEVSRVLYLDSDLLVRCDISELWRLALASGMLIQACEDPHPAVTPELMPMHAAQGIALGTTYYNAGVLGIDLEKWRSSAVLPELIAFLKRYSGEIPFADQGTLNACLGQRVDRLPDVYNRFSLVATEDARIVHFCTFRKPFVRPRSLLRRQDWALARWQSEAARSFHFREYFEVLDDTAYRGWRPRSLHAWLLKVTPGPWIDRLRATRWQRT
ncbi:hypothetical protein DB347_17095 [Opitutaceae bacterium EW11]|nr:hypothetical protein DB347_17095 [Opitutaceae bacterium EW11]